MTEEARGAVLAADMVDAIVGRAASLGDRIAIAETGGRYLTGYELQQRVEHAAQGLVDAGLRPGERVLFMVRPSLEAIGLVLAILRAGGVLVTAELGMGEALFATRMALVKPRWVVAEALLLALARFRPVRAVLRRRGVALPPLVDMADCRFVRVGRWWPGVPAGLDYARLLSRGAQTTGPETHTPTPSTEAFVVFTSGTTAEPRAVIHTQASLGATVHTLAESLALQASDVIYSSELHGLVPALLAGARAVIHRYGQWQAESVMRDFERHGVTHFFSTPGDVLELVNYAATRQVRLPSTLRLLLLGAAPVDRSFLTRLQAVLPSSSAVWCVYGMTEMLPVARVSMDEKLAANGRGDLVGTPFGGVQARLAADGELMLKGPHLSRGYLGEEPMHELATGDLASIDSHGRIVLLGRKKDMIIRGHDNIYPGLYEPAISALPGVRRCSLVGVYNDTVADERIVLVVEPEPGEDPIALEKRLKLELRTGPHRIDASAQPDEIVCMPIPLAGRSRKVDKRALLQNLRGQLRAC